MLKRFIQLFLTKCIFNLLALIFIILFCFSIKGLPAKATILPKIIIFYLLTPILIWNFIGNCLEIKNDLQKQIANVLPLKRDKLNIKETKKIMVIGILLGYILIIPYLGFIASTGVFMIFLSYLLGLHNFIKIGIFIIFTNIILYIIFVQWLGVRFPLGILM